VKATIHVGDCREVLKKFADNSIDAIVCDPPYEIGFMGKVWDTSGIAYSVLMWSECLRVLKPGGYLLSFGGSRTYHRMACAIEDAGFEIRDQIMWIYGSGFPKSLDVSKAIDKAARGVPQGGADPTSPNHGQFKGGCSEENPSGRGFGAGPGQFMKDSRSKYDGANRKPAPSTSGGFGYESKGGLVESEPLTDAAKRWSGYGTALKPAHEPICVARKPIEGTVAANVLKWGTGALNIDGCRVEYLSEADKASATPQGECTAKVGALAGGTQNETERSAFERPEQKGRWPANVIHDGSEEVVRLFPETGISCGGSGDRSGLVDNPAIFGKYSGENKGDSAGGFGDSGSAARFFYQVRGDEPSAERTYEDSGSTNFAMTPGARRLDDGSAARFFYTAKADRNERDAGLDGMPDVPCGMMEDDNYAINTGHGKPRSTSRQNNHPTVKPVDLMACLCRLVTPPHGIVLDPFTGSGSTGIAALREGFEFIGIEVDPKYAAIAEKRIKGDNPLFSEVELKA
jgi:site-specific DNA-methyltransferase (adenine-specific)